MVGISQSTAGWYTAASRVTCADVQCQDGLTKQKVMMHAGSTFKFQSLAQFAELQCKAAYKVELVQTAQTSIPLFYYHISYFCPELPGLSPAEAELRHVRHSVQLHRGQRLHPVWRRTQDEVGVNNRVPQI